MKTWPKCHQRKEGRSTTNLASAPAALDSRRGLKFRKGVQRHTMKSRVDEQISIRFTPAYNLPVLPNQQNMAPAKVNAKKEAGKARKDEKKVCENANNSRLA